MENNTSPSPATDTRINVEAYTIVTILADGSTQAIDVAAPGLEHPADGGKHTTDLLYLVEGISESTLTALQKLLPNLPDAFVNAHLCDNLGQIDNTLDDNHMFLAKWSRPAAQRGEVWLREKRLRTSKDPSNIDGVDPSVSRLDHERYEHITEPYRSYNPIYEFDIDIPVPRSVEGDEGSDAQPTAVVDEPCQGNDVEGQHDPSDGEENSTGVEPGLRTKFYVQDMLMHAAHECISFYHDQSGDKMIGIVIFDQPRQHRITEVYYNLMVGGEVETNQKSPEHAFQDDSSCLEKFTNKIGNARLAAHSKGTAEAVLDTIITIVVEDQRKLLASISRALDEIELSMGTNIQSPQNWRDFPPRWRNHLFHQSETIAYFGERMSEFSPASPSTSRTPARVRILARAQRELEATMRRLEGTYQVLMSSMSILESERAIEQAEVVTRLTNLAFFFIPLTFVSGLFGMNVVEFDQKLTVVMWVAVSLGVTAAAYFIRFRRPLAVAVHQTPQAIRRMRWDLLAARMRRWAQVLRHLAYDYNLIPVLFLALLAGALFVAVVVPAADETKIGVIPSFQVATQFLEPGHIISNKLRRLRPGNRIARLFLFAGAAVGLWAIATSSLPVNTRIGLALVVLRLPILTTLAWCHSLPPGRLGSTHWCYLTPKRRVQVPAHPLWFDLCRTALIFALAVALWKLFTSALSDAAKIGVAVGVMAVPLMMLGMPFFMLRDLDSKNVLRVITLITWGGVLGFLPIQAMAVWKVSTASTLSVSEKLAIGVAIHVGLFAITFLRQTASLESRELDPRGVQPTVRSRASGLASDTGVLARNPTVPPLQARSTGGA